MNCVNCKNLAGPRLGGPTSQVPGGMMPGMAGGMDASGGMFGLFQSLMMSMMTLMNGMMAQLAQGGTAALSGQSPGFGGSGGSSPGTGSFLGSGSAPAGGTGKPGQATGNLVDRQGKKLDSSIAGNFDAMVAAAKKDGVGLKITSGHRTRAEQERLYQASLVEPEPAAESS